MLLAQECPAQGTRLGLEIVGLRLHGGTATLGKAQNLKLGDHAVQRQAQAVADSHPMSRLHPVGVQMNLAAVDGGGGQASRLVEPAIQKPYVQSLHIGFVHARYNSPVSAINEFRARLDKDTRALDAAGLLKRERVIGGAQGPVVTLADGREMVNLCANNYLGLANHPEVVAAAHEALDRYGYGVASVRFICGTQRVHRELEERLSSYLSMEDAILYSSCFDANGGLFETLLDDQDAVISDALNHASIIDGIRLCKARRLRYANNDMNELEQALKDSQDARVRLIATDGVFSMDGSIAKLDAICSLADRYGALVMVDDSHATGLIGARGRGSHELRGVLDRIDIMTGTLGKALGGASGGYVAAHREIVGWLRQRSRPYLFSNSIAPPVAAATLKVLDILERSPELRERVHGNARYFRRQMQALGFDLLPGEHPIIPIMLGEAPLAVRLAEQCQADGVYVVAFAFPVVPHGKARIRTQMNAAHTTAQLDRVVQAFGRAGRDLGVIPQGNS